MDQYDLANVQHKREVSGSPLGLGNGTYSPAASSSEKSVNSELAAEFLGNGESDREMVCDPVSSVNSGRMHNLNHPDPIQDGDSGGLDVVKSRAEILEFARELESLRIMNKEITSAETCSPLGPSICAIPKSLSSTGVSNINASSIFSCENVHFSHGQVCAHTDY